MQKFLLERLENASAAGFPLLRRLPSTTVWKTLSYLDSLAEPELSTCLESCAAIAEENLAYAFGLRPMTPLPIGEEAEKTPRALLFREVFSKLRWSAFPDRFMQQFSGMPEALLEMVGEERLPAILASEPPVVAKAPAIRKVLHKHLKETWGAKCQNGGGGEWTCVGQHAGHDFSLSLDYGIMGPGFRYGVQFLPQSGNNFPIGGLTLESTYGFPTANCDFPLADELDELAETMSATIADLASLRKSLFGE